MKKTIVLIGIVLGLAACNDKTYYEYEVNIPVYTDYETFRSSVSFDGPQEITEKGNIYFKSDFLFMVEPDKGVHFIDNSNPSAPTQMGFLNVLGATNVAIRDHYMYVNSFIDLVVFDITSISNPVEIDRLENVFPIAVPQSDGNYPHETIDKSKGVVTSWKIEERKSEEILEGKTWINCPECDEFPPANQFGGWNNNGWGGVMGITQVNEANVSFDQNSGGGNTGTGIAGSISLFTIVNDYLYVIQEGYIMNPFNISNPASPTAAERLAVSREIETLFPYQDYIFMGTPSGMLIYGTDDPETPNFISALSHARGCDPVVVQDDIAYVTVRSGGACGGTINQLDVIDVSTITSPNLLASFNMKNPHGLGIDGNELFICDGKAGLKVFDATNPAESGNHLLHQFGNIQATDVIPFGNVAMVIGDDGIYQYDYSNPDEMKLLSKIQF